MLRHFKSVIKSVFALLCWGIIFQPLSFAEKQNTTTNEAIIKHLRSTKGVEFPDFSNQPKAQSSKEVKITKAELDFHKKAREATVNNPNRFTLLPTCESDITVKKPSGLKVSKKEADLVFFDMLFVDKKDMPLDPDLAFGESTQIIEYGKDGKSPNNLAIKGLKIPCLPYRVRGTPTFLYKQQGIDALKNYDKSPNGTGVLTDAMKVKLEGRGKI